jgi:large subunit ribosomal protein L29
MKANDLREKTLQDLVELRKTLAGDMFQNRLKNFTNRLDDTSSLRKARRDLARVMTVIRQVELRSVVPGAAAPEPVRADKVETPAAEPPKAKRAPKKKADAETAPAASPKKSSKKSEASSR